MLHFLELGVIAAHTSAAIASTSSVTRCTIPGAFTSVSAVKSALVPWDSGASSAFCEPSTGLKTSCFCESVDAILLRNFPSTTSYALNKSLPELLTPPSQISYTDINPRMISRHARRTRTLDSEVELENGAESQTEGSWNGFTLACVLVTKWH